MRVHLAQETDMPRGDKPNQTDKQKRQAPEAGARGWPGVNKLQGGAQKIASGRKIPSGPVGGSGRKTNLSRSS
jgi:hypothetical protein